MIKLIVFDVDGTLTDGGIIISDGGIETKCFSDADGLIIRQLPALGYVTAIITGRISSPVEVRARDLRITKLYHGIGDKVVALRELCGELGIRFAAVAYIGNDLNDYAAMDLCGWKACPADAVEEIKAICDYISKLNGGRGAVRDILAKLLKSENRYADFVKLFG
ncbi:MAG: HAD hydrolase family protein [Clostridiales bacterium]|jgi:3-deoxy-D-manno-octulosonate 8-phosphate phosphatase (KDO 8-P phosphatase)|nr:HAD hydrolase family protein [Clostridiales bacterium]